jgi:hypothetical protein
VLFPGDPEHPEVLEATLLALWTSPRRVLFVAREKRAQPWIDRGGHVLADHLAGANKADLVVVENRARSK